MSRGSAIRRARRLACVSAWLAVAVSTPQVVPAQAAPGETTRSIQRELPLPPQVVRARATGTRDPTGRPGPAYWQPWIDYTIQARLDPGTALLTGREVVRFRNDSPDTLRALQLRLDQNLFRPGTPRDATIGEETDGMNVTRLVVDGVPALIGTSTGSSRDAVPVATLSGTTRTSERVVLAQPLAPGSTVSLEIDWHFRVPRDETGAAIRMGRWADTVYQVAQWYPRIAMYDDLRGWDSASYRGEDEFHNPFARFEVSLDLPAGWLVGATGVLKNPETVLTPTARERLSRLQESDARIRIVGPEERGPGRATAAGNRLVWRFVADTASDFAWGASDRYVWDATRATIPGRGSIPVHLFYTADHADRFAKADGLARHALELYSAHFTPYGFPQLTLVDGPEPGMEYPMLAMTHGETLVHEIAHEWWPMTVGTDETRYGFLDEGLASYLTGLADADLDGRTPFAPGSGARYGRTSADEQGQTFLRTDSELHAVGTTIQSYGKPTPMLRMLGGIASDSTVWRALGAYAEAWRFRHPSPWDFAAFMSHALDRDLGWFWHGWLYSTASVDGAVEQVERVGDHTRITVRQDGEMPSPVVLAIECADGGPVMRVPANGVANGRTGATITYPVDVWFGGARTFTAELDTGCAVERVTLDPLRRFPDRDASDNIWQRTPSGRR